MVAMDRPDAWATLIPNMDAARGVIRLFAFPQPFDTPSKIACVKQAIMSVHVLFQLLPVASIVCAQSSSQSSLVAIPHPNFIRRPASRLIAIADTFKHHHRQVQSCSQLLGRHRAPTAPRRVQLGTSVPSAPHRQPWPTT